MVVAQGFQAPNDGTNEKLTLNGGADEIILKNNHAGGTADSECITAEIGASFGDFYVNGSVVVLYFGCWVQLEPQVSCGFKLYQEVFSYDYNSTILTSFSKVFSKLWKFHTS